jgi:hypothetical protein
MRVPIMRGAFALLALATCATATDQTQIAEDAPDDSTTSRAVVGMAQAPRTALIRSALVPGWGQLNNGHPLKAALFGGTAVGFLAAVLAERDNLSRTDVEIGNARTALAGLVAAGRDDPLLRARIARLEGEFEDQAARRNTRLLYLFTTATLAAVDAYVDAHLVDFGSANTSLDVMPRSDGVSFSLKWRLPTTSERDR